MYDLFGQLDELKVIKDFKMYFQLALVQLHILNDRAEYETYIAKMRSILELNVIFSKNHLSGGGGGGSSLDSSQQIITNENSCFLIVDANGSNFGKILLSNNNIRALLGWSDEQMNNLAIEDLMPQPILNKHAAFIKRFQHTGQSYIINNKATQFLKKSNGYVTPVELYIKFHYSLDYQYTFLAIFRPFHEMCPFANQQKYTMDQLLFFIVDNDIEGLVTEYSDSCPSIFRNFGLNFHQESTNITKRIQDLVIDLDFAHLRNTREERYAMKRIYEEEHMLDLMQMMDDQQDIAASAPASNNLIISKGAPRSDSSVQMHFSHVNHSSDPLSVSRVHAQNGKVLKVKTRVFEERYSDGILDLNIFCFAIVKDEQKQALFADRELSEVLRKGNRLNLQQTQLQIKGKNNVQGSNAA